MHIQHIVGKYNDRGGRLLLHIYAGVSTPHGLSKRFDAMKSSMSPMEDGNSLLFFNHKDWTMKSVPQKWLQNLPVKYAN